MNVCANLLQLYDATETNRQNLLSPPIIKTVTQVNSHPGFVYIQA